MPTPMVLVTLPLAVTSSAPLPELRASTPKLSPVSVPLVLTVTLPGLPAAISPVDVIERAVSPAFGAVSGEALASV